MIESFIKDNKDRYIVKSASIVNDELRLDCGHRGAMHITLTPNDYNSLCDADKMNGTVYYITDENKYYVYSGDILL
jgi:hypothetical protein